MDLQWFVNAYVLGFACLLLTGAALGDRFGRRRLFVLVIVAFTLARPGPAPLHLGASRGTAPRQSQPLPDSVPWFPLVGHPFVRRTWAVWNAGSHRRDLGHLVAARDQPTAS
ncbi:hypothetical protein [Streptomyces sp. R02]|uniref:Major facilitator superfamily (MFS) profile domain-containing protein n=1 Tax=Streptomyces sp. R02 TaxID=3238623 RepID=A0AB39LYR3_9ACTN